MYVVAYKLNIWKLCGIMNLKKTDKKNYNKLVYFIYILSISLVYFIIKDIPLYKSYTKLVKIIYLVLASVTIKFIIDIFIYNIASDIYIFISFISYLGILFITLYVRNNTTNNIIEDPTYIKLWIKLIFSNYIVFINLIYNILLFIPLGIFISFINTEYIYKLFIICIFIIVNELIQYIYKLGVFDYIDIILNIIGTNIGYILIKLKKGEKDGQRKQETT